MEFCFLTPSKQLAALVFDTKPLDESPQGSSMVAASSDQPSSSASNQLDLTVGSSGEAEAEAGPQQGTEAPSGIQEDAAGAINPLPLTSYVYEEIELREWGGVLADRIDVEAQNSEYGANEDLINQNQRRIQMMVALASKFIVQEF